MEKLSDSWITDGVIDFEYKKYILLSYVQTVSRKFEKVELYPSLAELVSHYQNLISLKRNKDLLYDNFPKELDSVSLEKLKLVYKKLSEEDDLINEVEEIMHFAEPLFKNTLEEGKQIYEYVESKCEVSPVGLVPLYSDEGYLFINRPFEKQLPVYKYQVKIIERPNEKLRGVHISLLDRVTKSVGNTYEAIKKRLIKQFKDFPNPATFLIHSEVNAPYTHTLEPIAKRLLVRYISNM